MSELHTPQAPSSGHSQKNAAQELVSMGSRHLHIRGEGLQPTLMHTYMRHTTCMTTAACIRGAAAESFLAQALQTARSHQDSTASSLRKIEPSTIGSHNFTPCENNLVPTGSKCSCLETGSFCCVSYPSHNPGNPQWVACAPQHHRQRVTSTHTAHRGADLS